MPNNNFILHGHFYQPPRENPWTGFIDRQESAYPYNDWNIRINMECYAACTRTPVFENSEIVKIINCFEYLSFNIGPTLCAWMEKKDGDYQTLKRIIEGDRISVYKNYGHGNAIAQVYSHMIMPLASEKDQYTQILWGLKDFKKRFGRSSEGIWLSETAINNETAAILVDCGIKFIILSPYQVVNVSDKGQTINVTNGNVDTSKPYKLHTKNGDLAIFFYNPYLASEISFGNLLRDFDLFKTSINDAFAMQNQEIKLVHTATDGEVYGHHKSYGNMTLAKLIYNVTNIKSLSFKFTNYGKFLADHPPTEECELYLGEDGKGSSWSCIHGVGRWYKDCGCHTGGADYWNQKWRESLRLSFDLLRDNLHSAVEDQTKDLLKNVWDARNDYCDIVLDNCHEIVNKFFQKHQLKELTKTEQKFIIQLMESLQYAMLMYTSCGWFFSELSGIETTQDMLYAARAYEFSKNILKEDINTQFNNILSNTFSNIKEEGNGVSIFNKSIQKYRISKNILIEYVCWLVISKDKEFLNQEFQEFSVEFLFIDENKNRYILKIKDHIEEDIIIACTLYPSIDKYTCTLLWIYIEESDNLYSDNEEFWINSNTWNTSALLSLPIFLRIRIISKHIQCFVNKNKYKDFSGDENKIFLNSIWGTETLLLPYEKQIISLHYISYVYEFAQDMIHKDTLEGIEFFIREVELLQKNIYPKDEAVLFLTPVAISLEKFLSRALNQANADMLKQSRIIFWSIKNSIDPVKMDILRDKVYRFQRTLLDKIESTVFLIEFEALLKEMEFSTH